MEQIDKSCRNCLHRNVCEFYEPNEPDCICNHYVGVDALKPKWIPVTKRLPEPQVLVLCRWERCKNDSRYGFATYQRDDVWYVLNEGMPKVTHWMPLPDAPEEIEK